MPGGCEHTRRGTVVIDGRQWHILLAYNDRAEEKAIEQARECALAHIAGDCWLCDWRQGNPPTIVDHFANTISPEWPSGWDLERTLNEIGPEDKGD